jgi:hypothetical protein
MDAALKRNGKHCGQAERRQHLAAGDARGRFVATIGGQSGGGKSFQAIHLASRLIPDCEQNFYIDKYRIKRHGGVLYLVLEGKPAFPLRVTAAVETLLERQMEFGDRCKLPFAWNTYAPNLFAMALIILSNLPSVKRK